jgi:hypothetical protein
LRIRSDIRLSGLQRRIPPSLYHVEQSLKIKRHLARLTKKWEQAGHGAGKRTILTGTSRGKKVRPATPRRPISEGCPARETKVFISGIAAPLACRVVEIAIGYTRFWHDISPL